VLSGDKDENYFVAANRSGKSDAGAYIDACLARFGRDPKAVYGAQAKGSDIRIIDRAVSIWVSSTTFPESRDVMQPKLFDNGLVPPGGMKPFIPDREIAEWHKTANILKLKVGSLIGFKSADAGPKSYQGTEKDAIHFDEEHPRDVVNEASIRVGAGKRLKVYTTATLLPPEGQAGGVTWVYTEVLKPWLEGKLPNVGCFGSSVYDNPHLLPEEIRRMEAKYPTTGLEGRIRLLGEWLPGISGARAYPSFDSRIHVKEIPPLHDRRPLAWTWDFNVEPMISIVGQRFNDTFRVYRTLEIETDAQVSSMVDYFIERFPHHHAEIHIFGDATGQSRNAAGAAYYNQIVNGMRGYGVPVRMKVPETNPPVPDRIAAVNNALRNEYGVSCVEISNEPGANDHLIKDLEEVLRDNRGGLKKVSNKKDPYYYRTHSSDALGYWISKEAPVRRTGLVQRLVNAIPSPGYGWVARG
jgi:hypothetical protein